MTHREVSFLLLLFCDHPKLWPCNRNRKWENPDTFFSTLMSESRGTSKFFKNCGFDLLIMRDTHEWDCVSVT